MSFSPQMPPQHGRKEGDEADGSTAAAHPALPTPARGPRPLLIAGLASLTAMGGMGVFLLPALLNEGGGRQSAARAEAKPPSPASPALPAAAAVTPEQARPDGVAALQAEIAALLAQADQIDATLTRIQSGITAPAQPEEAESSPSLTQAEELLRQASTFAAAIPPAPPPPPLEGASNPHPAPAAEAARPVVEQPAVRFAVASLPEMVVPREHRYTDGALPPHVGAEPLPPLGEVNLIEEQTPHALATPPREAAPEPAPGTMAPSAPAAPEADAAAPVRQAQISQAREREAQPPAAEVEPSRPAEAEPPSATAAEREARSAAPEDPPAPAPAEPPAAMAETAPHGNAAPDPVAPERPASQAAAAQSPVAPPTPAAGGEVKAQSAPAMPEASASPAPAGPAAPAVPAAAPEPATPALSREAQAAILQRAEEKLALGDVATARTLYREAAQGGSSKAAAALGRTYQEDFLRGIGARGVAADPLLAAVWARRAEALAASEPQPPEAPPAEATSAPPMARGEPPRPPAPPAPVAPAPPQAASGAPAADQPAPSASPAPAAPPPSQATAAVPGVATPVEPPATPGQASPPRPSTAIPAEELEAVIRRADSMLALRDISAARLLYAYAAQAGSGRAASALGRTYDPAFLESIGAQGIRPDPALAAQWYRRAVALGEAQAAAALSRLERR